MPDLSGATQVYVPGQQTYIFQLGVNHVITQVRQSECIVLTMSMWRRFSCVSSLIASPLRAVAQFAYDFKTGILRNATSQQITGTQLAHACAARVLVVGLESRLAQESRRRLLSSSCVLQLVRWQLNFWAAQNSSTTHATEWFGVTA